MELSLWGVACFVDGIKATGENLTLLKEIGAFLKLLNGPWLLLADFNMLPRFLMETGWLQSVRGRLHIPQNTQFTCRNGGGLLDYAVSSEGVADGLLLLGDLDGPWRPHLGLNVTAPVKFDADTVNV